MGIITAGRGTDSRVAAGVGTTAASLALTGPAGTFGAGDVGRTVTGTGLAANATIASVQSATAATASANSSAIGTITATIGAAAVGSAGELAAGFRGWSPETITEAASYTVAAKNAGTGDPGRPVNITDDLTARQRSRS